MTVMPNKKILDLIKQKLEGSVVRRKREWLEISIDGVIMVKNPGIGRENTVNDDIEIWSGYDIDVHSIRINFEFLRYRNWLSSDSV